MRFSCYSALAILVLTSSFTTANAQQSYYYTDGRPPFMDEVHVSYDGSSKVIVSVNIPDPNSGRELHFVRHAFHDNSRDGYVYYTNKCIMTLTPVENWEGIKIHIDTKASCWNLKSGSRSFGGVTFEYGLTSNDTPPFAR